MNSNHLCTSSEMKHEDRTERGTFAEALSTVDVRRFVQECLEVPRSERTQIFVSLLRQEMQKEGHEFLVSVGMIGVNIIWKYLAKIELLLAAKDITMEGAREEVIDVIYELATRGAMLSQDAFQRLEVRYPNISLRNGTELGSRPFLVTQGAAGSVQIRIDEDILSALNEEKARAIREKNEEHCPGAGALRPTVEALFEIYVRGEAESEKYLLQRLP